MVAGHDPKGPILISYRQSDGREIAAMLDGFLRSGGLVPWRDLVDLPPGETAQRVTEAFEEGISNAVLIVTRELGESRFVPQIEVPPLLAMDADTEHSKPFHLLLVNTIPDKHRGRAVIDVAAPDRLLEKSKYWPPKDSEGNPVEVPSLINLKQYALLPGLVERRQLYADLLDARLSARVAQLADKEVVIQTQTRPEGNARSRLSGSHRSAYVANDPDDPYDLIIRLRQDRRTGVPSEESLRFLQETLPLMVDGLHGHGVEKVRMDAAGHTVLLWALGAALPVTRISQGKLMVEDIHNNRWYDRLPLPGSQCSTCSGSPYRPDRPDEIMDKKLFTATFDPELKTLSASSVPQDRLTRALVVLEFGDGRINSSAVKKLRAQGRWDLNLNVKVRGETCAPFQIPSAEGARLAAEIMNGLRQMVNLTGIDEIHVVSNFPTAMMPLLGRLSNTLTIVIHEWGIGPGGDRQYLPVARIQAGMPGGPITEVYKQTAQNHPWLKAAALRPRRLRAAARRPRGLSVRRTVIRARRHP